MVGEEERENGGGKEGRKGNGNRKRGRGVARVIPSLLARNVPLSGCVHWTGSGGGI